MRTVCPRLLITFDELYRRWIKCKLSIVALLRPECPVQVNILIIFFKFNIDLNGQCVLIKQITQVMIKKMKAATIEPESVHKRTIEEFN